MLASGALSEMRMHPNYYNSLIKNCDIYPHPAFYQIELVNLVGFTKNIT